MPGYRGFVLEEHQRPLPQLFRICNGIPVVLDQVLRFFAYVRESSWEAAPEGSTRRCVILYYLEDATLAINEQHQPGSGLSHGAILRRHKSSVQLKDLSVGNNLTLFSRTYHIIGADGFTRRFMEERGLPLAADMAVPEDEWERRERERRTARQQLAAQRQPPNNRDTSNAVLRFHCYWDDRLALYGDMRLFTLYYYLADDSIEVVEVLPRNCGRDPVPHMLRRMRLPKHPGPVGAWPPSAGSRIRRPEDYYQWHELRVGSHVEVYGRKLMVYDCDAFTRHWFTQHLHMDEAALTPIPVPSIEPKVCSREVPPDALGIGAEEDSLQNVLRLLPKAPKKDLNKFVRNDGKVLRFTAVLHARAGSSPADAAIDRDRSFVVSFFLADDTVLIFERVQPNSGWLGGKFLERCRIMNPEASTYYGPKDMTVGATVHAAGRAFLLTGADEYTRNYIDAQKQQSRGGQ
ncbi:EF-hand domain-containing family member C2 [Coccomyxa sp. Obi]|nr:EF-hand domain-containing family member C2 [Coccomyxa sp. Obi]